MTYEMVEAFCPGCGYCLAGAPCTVHAWCPACGQYQIIDAWLDQPPVTPEDNVPGEEIDEGLRWNGTPVLETCAYCGQPIYETDDPRVGYCSFCGNYQLHA